jgi:hypothetical protein
MTDIFPHYEQGLEELLERLGKNHPRYTDALTLQTRLLENIAQTQRYGDTETRRAERAQILDTLNQLASQTVRVSFNKLYLSSLESTQTPQWEPTADLAQTTDMRSRMVAEHTDRLEAMLAASLAQTSEQVEFADLANQLTTFAMPQLDSAPLPPRVYATRENLVSELCNGLADVTWLALVDGPGRGKTQLARAIAQASGVKHIWWILLRSQEGTAAYLHLERQIARWLVQLSTDERLWDLYIRGWMSLTRIIELVSESVGEDGLLIVDNLPDSFQDEVLFHALNSLATIFAAYGTKLLTTGQRDLPPALQSDLGTVLSTIKPPPFSKDDILELLKSAGAPEEVRTDVILGSTAGHPSLVAATVYWLRRHKWGLREEDWAALLTGEPLEDVREHERRRAICLLDERSREFLYRLSLLWTEFDKTLALKVAAILPPVEHPGECLDELTGPWLDHMTGDQYEVTPLLRGAGQHNLSEEVQKRVHRVVADHYLSQGTIYPSQALTISTHLWGAGDYRGFAMFLIQLLLSAKMPAQAKQVEWAASVLPPDMEWPTELDLDLRIMLRAAQVRTRALSGRDIAVLDTDLERLIAKAGPDNSRSVVFAYIYTGPLLNEMPVEIAMRRTIQAVRLLRDNPLFPDETFPSSLEQIMWFPAMRLEEPTQIRQLLMEICKMTDEERERLFEGNMATEAISLLIDRIWWIEADKPTGQRDWDSALRFLNEIQEMGSLMGTIPLQVAEARARAVILADYLGQPDTALSILDATPDPKNPDFSFLLHYTAGCVLFDADQSQNALHRLDAAAASGGDAFSYFRFDAKRRAAITQSKLGEWDDAKRRCVKVIHLAAETLEFLVYDRLEMMGELAWIHWVTGNRRKACAAMYGFVTGLAAIEGVAEPRFREAFNKAGHGVGWFSAVAATGQPPPATITGEPYAPVEAGTFGILRERLGDYVPPVGFSKALLLNQLGMLAGALDLSHMAWKVYKLANSLVQEGDNEVLLGPGKTELASLTARLGHPNEAINLGLRAVRALGVGKKLHEDKIDVLNRNINIQDVWVSISEEDRRIAERQLLYLIFGPAFSDLLGADLSEDEMKERLTAWYHAVSMRREAFEDPEFWDKVVQIFKGLSSVWAGKSLREENLNIPEDEPVLKVLWHLVASSQPKTKLVDSLQMQVVALDFLIKSSLGKHMLPGAGRFVHRFWLDVANTRGFALNSPQLFRKDLLAISPRQGVKTGVKVLRSASRAVGISLPEDILTRFRQMEGPETY